MKVVSKLFFAFFAAWILIELLSASTHTAINIIHGGHTIKDSLVKRYNELQGKYYDNRLTYGAYSINGFHPKKNTILTGPKDLPGKIFNSKTDDISKILYFNDFGFLSNGRDDYLLKQYFPKKPKDIFRIVLLGGSSALGVSGQEHIKKFTGAHETIASILEKKLNFANKISSMFKGTFEVLNFAELNGSSSKSLDKLNKKIVGLKPNLVITYNGFDDSYLERHVTNVIDENDHWFQKIIFKFFPTKSNDEVSNLTSRLFPFTTSLTNKIFFRLLPMVARQPKSYKDSTSKLIKYKNTDEDTQNTGNSEYIKNMKNFGLTANRNKFFLISFLQPNALWNIKSEGPYRRSNSYSKSIIQSNYLKYKRFFANKKSLNSDSRYDLFYDQTDIFNKQDEESVYQEDGFHLTPLGNEIIANEYLKIIGTIL